jgi:hypothetical protein
MVSECRVDPNRRRIGAYVQTKTSQTPFRVAAHSVEQPLPRGLLDFKLFPGARLVNGPLVEGRALLGDLRVLLPARRPRTPIRPLRAGSQLQRKGNTARLSF